VTVATQTETAIQALALEVNTLKAQVQALRGETEPLREITKQIAVIEHRLSEITRTKELWGQRGWMSLTICLSAFFSLLTGVFGTLMTFYLNIRKSLP
jgi:hypothetical protein